MDHMIIREALPGDAAVLAELCGQLGYPCSSEEVGEYLAQISKTKGHQVYVAIEAENLVLGWAHVFKTHRLMTPPFAELGGLIVSSSARGGGIGVLLLREAEGWARSNRCRSMRICSNIIRSGAHQFYERRGYRVDKNQHVFLKALTESEVRGAG